MSSPLAPLSAHLPAGLSLQPHQAEAVSDALEQAASGALARLCLYHRTGAGKTITSLSIVRALGYDRALVLAPPSTREGKDGWLAWGARLGVEVEVISHAKFRQKDYRISRKVPLIVDEFHLLGGHTGMGWKKMDRLAAGLQAPLIICSATPNYNDAERVYCVQHVLAPDTVKGGYIQWLYQNCTTEENPFAKIPNVTGFHQYKDAEEFLSSLPYVHYVEDEVIKQVVIADIDVSVPPLPDELETYGLARREGRMIASLMEGRHVEKRLRLLDDDGLIRTEVYEELAVQVGNATTPTLVYCNSAEVASALQDTCVMNGVNSLLVTGKHSHAEKARRIEAFKRGEADILIGTATLATGTDGLDKMCDQLVIVDDTDDRSLRRQLMGRILPRGLDTDVSRKVISRLVYS